MVEREVMVPKSFHSSAVRYASIDVAGTIRVALAMSVSKKTFPGISKVGGVAALHTTVLIDDSRKAKAPPSISVTLSGMSIETPFIPANAFPPNLVTSLGIIVFLHPEISSLLAV